MTAFLRSLIMKLGVSLLLVWLTAQATAWAQPAYPRQTYPQGPSVQITVTPPPVYYPPPAYGYTPPRRAEPQWQRPPGWYDDAPGQRRHSHRGQHPNETPWERPPGWYDPPAGSRR
jgi:hypothetical protein